MKNLKSNFPGLEYAEVLSREQLKKVIAGTRVAAGSSCGTSCTNDAICSSAGTCLYCRENVSHIKVCTGPVIGD